MGRKNVQDSIPSVPRLTSRGNEGKLFPHPHWHYGWEGLRVKDLEIKEIDGDQEYFLQVVWKQTMQKKGEGKKKQQEAYVPQKVASDLNMVIRMDDLSNEDTLLPNRFGEFYTPKGIQKRIGRVANTAYEETGDEIYSKVSSHDLRRFFAHYHRSLEFSVFIPFS